MRHSEKYKKLIIRITKAQRRTTAKVSLGSGWLGRTLALCCTQVAQCFCENLFRLWFLKVGFGSLETVCKDEGDSEEEGKPVWRDWCGESILGVSSGRVDRRELRKEAKDTELIGREGSGP